MAQASIPLLSHVSVGRLDQALYDLTLAVNASGIGSAPIVPVPPGLRLALAHTLNAFALSVNAVTAPGTVTLLYAPVSPSDLTRIVNIMIIEINAFVSGGGSYTAKAVHFDGNAYLDNVALVTGDSRYIAWSQWLKVPQSSIDNEYQLIGKNAGFPGVSAALSTNSIVFPAHNGFIFLVYDTSGNSRLTLYSAADAIVPDVWLNIRAFIDTQAQTGKLFVGLDDVTALVDVIGSPFTIQMNGAGIGVPDTIYDTYAVIGDIADCWLEIGQNIDMAANADGALFIDGNGKPKDPSGFPTGFALFSGDADTFPVNQGTGGVFTLTGALTNASTSPSD